MEKELEQKLKIGLTSEEVAERKAAGQVNGDLNVKTKSYKQIIFGNLFTLFNLVNVILVICVILVGSWKNGLFFLVVIWNFLLSCAQEIRAKKTIDRLSILSAPKAHALRDGKLEEIQVSEIVLGEITQLKSGNQICADAVVLEGECQVNESLITGESTPILKKTGDHLLSGSFLISGSVMAEVEHVGEENYVNKITLGAKYYKKPTSVIMKSVKMIVRIVAIALIPVAGLLIWKNFFAISQPFPDAMVKVVAAISAMIPGGLILLVSIVLAVSVIRLSVHRTLVQDLYCVENLARVDVLCLDKTGTITEGVMNMEKIVPVDLKMDTTVSEEKLKRFVSLMEDENSTIDAIRRYYDVSYQPEEAGTKKLRTVPFSSEAKWSLLYEEGKGCTIMGAPEFVYSEGADNYRFILDNYMKRAKRVLLLAESEKMPRNENGEEAEDGKFLPEEIKPVAFLIFGDKVRSDAKQTLDYFDDQQVTLKVISGDSPQTVSMVAAEAGMKDYDKWIDASKLQSYEEIEAVIDDYMIFGRVTPYQKLDIIKALKAHGHTVAMTGDGANDVLALKEADCSIAMQSGSDAARNVANMVLMDSNFASLPLVVAEGRKSINNLQRSAALYLTKTTYAFILAIVFLFVSFAYPFENIQVTLIGATTIGITSFFLALEPNKNRIRKHFLRNVFTPAVPSGVMTAAAIIAVTVIARNMGADTLQIGTVATFTALISGFIVVFNISGKLNLWKFGLLAFVIAIAAVACIFFDKVFDIVPISGPMVWVIVITGAIFLVVHTAIFRFLLPWWEKREESRS
ncbi:MAG: HAD-IC family P-type ATPase [Parasporobacterium sp.]|nr:HAD-IC family P-type ATPase [Parasporobacterium sp.]